MEDLTFQLAQNELKKYGLAADFRENAELPSFEISAKDGKVTISAPNSLEMLYGVYELAEKFGGYCFFEPGKDRFREDRKVRQIPDGILVPARKPALEIRGFIQEFPFNDETPMLLDWMAKNKMNYIQVWMKYYDDLTPEYKEMARVRGITIESGHHNFNYWIPGRKYNATHPEYFAEINGKRIQSSDGKSTLLLSEQLCTTNPELREEIIQNMLAYLDKYPEVKIIALVPNDGFGWCECKECSKYYDKNEMGDFYSVSEHVYKANRIYHDLIQYVGTRLHEKRPDVHLSFCAYINYCRPSEGMTLTPGLMVWFANYWRCINHDIDDPACPINSHYADDIRSWVDVNRGGKVCVYEYFMGVNFYISLPMVHIMDIFKEVAWYEKNHVDGLATQFHIPHWSVYGVNYYMFAKAARGETAPQAPMRMMEDLFGKDALAGSMFYDALKKTLLDLGGCHIPYPHSILSRITSERCSYLLNLAKGLASLAPEDPLRQDIVVWMEYLCRFKELFDLNEAGTLTLEKIEELQAWMHSFKGRRIFVLHRVDTYFEAIKAAVKNGRKWLHFNLDWEDAYIRRHHQLWTGHNDK